MTFQANCLLETICLKCHILFSGKNKKNIINLSSAENAQRVVKVKIAYTPQCLRNGSKCTNWPLFSQAWTVGQGQNRLMVVGRVHHGGCIYEVSLMFEKWSSMHRLNTGATCTLFSQAWKVGQGQFQGWWQWEGCITADVCIKFL